MSPLRVLSTHLHAILIAMVYRHQYLNDKSPHGLTRVKRVEPVNNWEITLYSGCMPMYVVSPEFDDICIETSPPNWPTSPCLFFVRTLAKITWAAPPLKSPISTCWGRRFDICLEWQSPVDRRNFQLIELRQSCFSVGLSIINIDKPSSYWGSPMENLHVLLDAGIVSPCSFKTENRWSFLLQPRCRRGHCTMDLFFCWKSGIWALEIEDVEDLCGFFMCFFGHVGWRSKLVSLFWRGFAWDFHQIQSRVSIEKAHGFTAVGDQLCWTIPRNANAYGPNMMKIPSVKDGQGIASMYGWWSQLQTSISFADFPAMFDYTGGYSHNIPNIFRLYPKNHH